MHNSLVSVIIVNWNGADVLVECLNSLCKQEYKPLEIIVVDNNSHDQSVDIIKHKFKSIKLIASKTNLGFARGNNFGYAQAKGKYILLLNNDTVVTPRFLFPLVAQLKKDSTVGVVQPKILFSQNPLYTDSTLNSCGTFLTSTGFLYHFGYGKDPSMPLYNKKMQIFSAHGACMLIRKTLIEKIGLFDPDFFAYFEESDFCLRAWIAGEKTVYEPQSMIYHRGSVTTRKFGSTLLLFHSYKNRVNSYVKNFELLTVVKILPFHLLLCEFASLSYLLLGRFGSFIAVQKALIWNLLHLRQTYIQRYVIQHSIRKLSDKTILPFITKNPRSSYYYYLFTGLGAYKDDYQP